MSANQLANASQMGEPVNPWMMETGSFWIWGALLLLTLIWTLKDKRLPLFGLVLIAATSSFWQEFFGDWGAYVAWNPAFARLPFWGEMAYTTPVTLVSWLGQKFPKLSTNWLSLLIAFPLFLAYQIYVEGSSVANGWWTYDVVIGPALESDKGQLPLIFPILLGLWAAYFVAKLAKRNADGFWPHEITMGVAAKPAGWRRELARIWAMIVLFQVSFFIFNIGSAMLGRALFGGPSLLVP
jgi:hypothetical protein